jgi:phage repressor protein C with HTH and peptisase S24 domain
MPSPLQLHAQRLQEGQTVQFRPRGDSMTPRIHSGDLVTVSPDVSDLQVGDIVLCRVKGNYYLHLISAKLPRGRYQISNNQGHVNGNASAVFGKVIRVER